MSEQTEKKNLNDYKQTSGVPVQVMQIPERQLQPIEDRVKTTLPHSDDNDASHSAYQPSLTEVVSQKTEQELKTSILQTSYENTPDHSYSRIDDYLPSGTDSEDSASLDKPALSPVPEDQSPAPPLTFPNPYGSDQKYSFPSQKRTKHGFLQYDDDDGEIDCCKIYSEACYITFSCGIPILMQQRKKRQTNAIRIDEKPIRVDPKIFNEQNKVCSCSIQVFLMIITCGIYGLIQRMRKSSKPTPTASIKDQEELKVVDTTPPHRECKPDCSIFTRILHAITSCGMPQCLSPVSTPVPEDKENIVTDIDSFIGDETQEIVEPVAPIVSFTPEQTIFLQEIRPIVYTSIAQFNPDDTSSKSSSSCCTSCMNACCQTCSCDLLSILPGRSKSKSPQMKKEEFITPTLQKASDEGRKLLSRIIFPLVLDVAREVWVALELVTTLIGLILSIATVSFNENEVFNIIHLILIIITSILSFIDAASALIKCQSCKTCYSILRKKEKASSAEGKEATKPCCKCLLWCNDKLDTVRLILAEVLVYPLLVCDIFEVIVGRGHESSSHSDRLGFSLFLLSCISLLLYVYAVRLMVLGRSIRHLKNIRSLEVHSRQESELGFFAVKEAFKYQIFFVIHFIFQMLAQIMMLIAIGGKIRYDNRHFYEPGNADESIYYSGHLIIMLVIGYIAPTLGYLSFFIVTKPWAEEFPIGVFNDLTSQLKLLKTGDFGDFFQDRDDLNDENEAKISTNFRKMSTQQKMQQLKDYFNRFSNDYEKLRNRPFFKKIEYPFRNPGIVLLSLLYAGMQLTFIVCAGVAVDDMGVVVSQILNGGGWVGYYIFAIIFGAVANVYVFLVAAFWIFIVVAVVAIIVGVILCFILVIILMGIASSNSNNIRRQY